MKNLFYGAAALTLLMAGASFSALELQKRVHYKRIVQAEDQMIQSGYPYGVLHSK